jgi:hypothetical protein
MPVNAFTERIVCRACNRANELDAELWSSLLDDAISEFQSLEVDEGQSSTVMTGGGTWELVYGNQLPRCGSCKATFPEQALGFAERGWAICVACGKRFGIRPAPPSLAKLGAVALVNEDAAQIAGSSTGEAMSVPVAKNPVVFSCPRCSGALTVDGSTRLVRCQYCSSDVYLPDDLWQRLHPVTVVSRWHLWFSVHSARAAFRWSSIHDAVIGVDHLVYCVGTSDGMDEKLAVWCMGPDFEVRWRRDDVKLDVGWGSDVHLTITPQGRLYLWCEERTTATVLSAADGATLGTLGEKERTGAVAHGFDLSDATQLHADVDGTLLALIGERLVRYHGDGSPLATWPPRTGMFGAKAEKLRPLYEDGSLISVGDATIDEMKDQPLGLRSNTRLCIGRDGRLYARYADTVGCIDRSGKVVYRKQLRVNEQIGADAYGHLYVLGKVDDRRTLVRVAPDGSRVDVVATARKQGGVLGDESVLTVGSDGTCILLGASRTIRVIAPDGRLVYQSDASKKWDAEADED